MYIGNPTDVKCISCAERAKQLVQQAQDTEEWLSRDEVKLVCEPCYNNMVKSNISRIKKKHFLEKFQGTKMKFYEITYKGPEKSKLNIGGHSIDSGGIMYFGMDELPITEEHLATLPNTEFSIVEKDAKPSYQEVKAKVNSGLGKVGIKWTGNIPIKATVHGHFKRDEVVWVSPAVSQDLMINSGFKQV